MFTIGQIPVCWNMQEIESLEYFYSSFNDPATVDHWDQLYQCSFRGGQQADFRSEQPAFTQEILNHIASNNIMLTNIGTNYFRMMPGEILPYHQDMYVRYCEHHKVKLEQVSRIIVFLQEWNSGFLFEIDQEPVVKYPAGTYVCWSSTTPHMAGNLGSVARYTLQITGTRYNV